MKKEKHKLYKDRLKTQVYINLNIDQRIEIYRTGENTCKQIYKYLQSNKGLVIWDIWDFGQLPKVNSKKQSTGNKTKNNPISKWAKGINRHFMEEGIQVANKLIMRK